MSAPDGPRHYFADYEVYQDGHAVAWGQVTHSLSGETDVAPASLVHTLRSCAAKDHGVEAGAIRLRCVERL
jgi:hypothetical protein